MLNQNRNVHSFNPPPVQLHRHDTNSYKLNRVMFLVLYHGCMQKLSNSIILIPAITIIWLLINVMCEILLHDILIIGTLVYY